MGLGELVVSGGVTPDEYIFDKRTLLNPDLDSLISRTLGDKRTKIIYGDVGTIEVPTTKQEYATHSLTDCQAKDLAHRVQCIENIYRTLISECRGVDIEWALDAVDGKIYILQSRPETVHRKQYNDSLMHTSYIIEGGEPDKSILSGIAVGTKIGAGTVRYMATISDFAI